MNPSITITIELRWVLAYLIVGLALFVPLNYAAHKQIAPPRPAFWPAMRRSWRRWWISVLLWPLAVWELRS